MTDTLTLHQRLINAQRDFAETGITKKEKNSYQKYNYRSVEQLLEAANACLTKNGIHILIQTANEEMTVENLESTDERWYTLKMVMSVVFFDDSGNSLEAKLPGIHSSKEPAKLTGQLSSYILKELLFKQFLIPVKGIDDIDSFGESEAQPAKKTRKKRTTKKTPPAAPKEETKKSGAKSKATPASETDGNDAEQPASATTVDATVEPVTEVTQGADRKLVIQMLARDNKVDSNKLKVWFAQNADKSVVDMEDDEWLTTLDAFKAEFGIDE